MLGEVEVRTRSCSCHQPALSWWRRCNLAAAILGPVVSRLQEEKFSVYFFFKLHSFMYMNNTPPALPLVLYWKNKALKDSADLLSVFNITLGIRCVNTCRECYRYRYLIDWNFLCLIDWNLHFLYLSWDLLDWKIMGLSIFLYLHYPLPLYLQKVYGMTSRSRCNISTNEFIS